LVWNNELPSTRNWSPEATTAGAAIPPAFPVNTWRLTRLLVVDAAEGDVLVVVPASAAAGAVMEVVEGARLVVELEVVLAPTELKGGCGGMGGVAVLLADTGGGAKEEAIAVEGSLATEALASLVVELEDAVEIVLADPNLTVIAVAAAVAVAVPDSLTVTAVAQ